MSEDAAIYKSAGGRVPGAEGPNWKEYRAPGGESQDEGHAITENWIQKIHALIRANNEAANILAKALYGLDDSCHHTLLELADEAAGRLAAPRTGSAENGGMGDGSPLFSARLFSELLALRHALREVLGPLMSEQIVERVRALVDAAQWRSPTDLPDDEVAVLAYREEAGEWYRAYRCYGKWWEDLGAGGPEHPDNPEGSDQELPGVTHWREVAVPATGQGAAGLGLGEEESGVEHG